MSRTIAHQPVFARLGDPAVRFEVHDHRFGPCDLVDVGDWVGLNFDDRVTLRCRWEFDFFRQPATCGCMLCSEQFEHRQQRRRDRHQTRAALRRVMKGDEAMW